MGVPQQALHSCGMVGFCVGAKKSQTALETIV
jgi:hypothetical protein